MSYSSVTVGSGSAILLLANNTNRLSVIITNNGNYPIHLGSDSLVTTNTGIFIDAGGNYAEDSGGQRTYLGDYYAISEDSTSVVAYWERTR